MNMKKYLSTLLLLLTLLPSTLFAQQASPGSFYRISEMKCLYILSPYWPNKHYTYQFSWHKNEGADYNIFHLFTLRNIAKPLGAYTYLDNDYPPHYATLDTFSYHYPVLFDSIKLFKSRYDSILYVFNHSGDKLMSCGIRAERQQDSRYYFYNHNKAGTVSSIMTYMGHDSARIKADSFYYDGAQRMIRHISSETYGNTIHTTNDIQYDYNEGNSLSMIYRTEKTSGFNPSYESQHIYHPKPGIDSIVTVDPGIVHIYVQVNYRTSGLIDSIHYSGFLAPLGDTVWYDPYYSCFERNERDQITKITNKTASRVEEIIFEYSSTHKLTTVTKYLIDNGLSIKIGKEVLEYDHNDNLKTYSTYSRYDQEQDKWTQYEYDFVYNLTYELHERKDYEDKTSRKKTFFDIFPYPNPASQYIRINVGKFIFDKVEVYDMSGKLVLLDATPSPLFNYTTLSISNLAAGEYIVKVHTGQGIGVGRFIKIW